MTVDASWYQTFFNNLIVESWRHAVSYFPTPNEAKFLKECFSATPGGRILDVPCGTGRLTVALAEMGFALTGFDLTADLLDDARRAAAERQLSATFVQGDMTQLSFQDEFDGAFCFGNSFAYFDDERNAAFLRGVRTALKPGGTFVLQTNFAAEGIFTHAIRGRWYPMGDLYCLHDTVYDPATAILTSTYILIRGTQIEKKQAHYRIYTYREILSLLRDAGLTPVETFGTLERGPFVLGSDSLYVVSRRA